MRNFKHGNCIIHNNNEYYVSYPDKDGDFVFLTNDTSIGNFEVQNFIDSNFFSRVELKLIREEAEKFGYMYYIHPTKRNIIYTQFKFATKQKLKNILNR